MNQIYKKKEHLFKMLVSLHYYYLVDKLNLKTNNKLMAVGELKQKHMKNLKLWERTCYKALDYYAEKSWIKELIRYIKLKAKCFDYSSLYVLSTRLTETEITDLMHLEKDERQEKCMNYEFLEESYKKALIQHDLV